MRCFLSCLQSKTTIRCQLLFFTIMFEIFGFIWIIESVFEVGVCLIDDQIGPTFLIRADTLAPTLFTLEQKVALDKGDLC